MPTGSLHRPGTCLLIILFSLIIFTQGCSQKKDRQGAPPAVTPRLYPVWVKTFGGQDILNSIYPTADGGFIAAGKTTFRKTYHDAWIVKLDAGGNVQWQRGFGGKYQDEFFAVLQSNDSGYLAAGMTVNETGAWIGLLVRLDRQGAVRWQKTVPQLVFKSLLQAPDGDFILTGGSTAFGASGTALVITRLGPDGQCKWQKTYGSGDGRVVRQTSDGGYIALGSVWDLGHYETLILKIDSAGTAQWQRQYRGTLNAMEQTTDGGFMLAGAVGVSDKDGTGNIYHFGPGNLPSGPNAVNDQGWLLKLDRNGEAQWQKLYGGVFKDEFTAMRKTGEGKLAVIGNTMSYGAGNGDLWLLLFEENGTILWQRAIGGPKPDYANDLQPTADGGFFIAGLTFSFGSGAERALLAKLDSTGNIPGCTLPAFNLTDSTAEGKDILPSQRPFPTQGQNSSLMLSSSTVPFFDVSVPAANYYPAEPKLVLSDSTINIGPTSRDTRNLLQMRVLNAGAADLTIKEMKIVKKDDGRSWFARAWDWITRRPGPSFSVTHTCSTVGPAADCTCTVEFKSPSPGETRAMLTIISNDPDAPVMTVPVHAAVQ